MIKTGLLGASGLVGETYRELLEDHPLFELVFAPKREELGALEKAQECELIFSALPNEAASVFDPLYAQAGFPVFSSASCHRMEEDIPLIIPEINPDHFELIETQQKNRGWKGFIVAKPNCTLQSMLLPLYPLHKRFQLTGVCVTYLQARSGAGRDFSLSENVIPFIADEEEKCEREVQKILGDPALKISSHCIRVPVPHGHLASISASFERKPMLEEVKEAWASFQPTIYLEGEDRPQPLLDLEEGMAVKVGRLRPCPLMDLRFVALSHNLIRGAAGGGLLTAQYWSQHVNLDISRN